MKRGGLELNKLNILKLAIITGLASLTWKFYAAEGTELLYGTILFLPIAYMKLNNLKLNILLLGIIAGLAGVAWSFRIGDEVGGLEELYVETISFYIACAFLIVLTITIMIRHRPH